MPPSLRRQSEPCGTPSFAGGALGFNPLVVPPGTLVVSEASLGLFMDHEDKAAAAAAPDATEEDKAAAAAAKAAVGEMRKQQKQDMGKKGAQRPGRLDSLRGACFPRRLFRV